MAAGAGGAASSSSSSSSAASSPTASGTGGVGGATSSGPVTSAGGQGGAGGAEPAGCDPDEKATKSEGLFVDAAAEGAGTGTLDSPFSSLGDALAAASGTTTKQIFVASGVYPGTLVLGASAKGVSVVGGWVRKPGAWTRDCSEGARDKVRIEGDGVGVRVEGADGVRLSTLTVVAKGATGQTEAGDGVSVYGIFATGETARLTLEGVAILAGDATGGVTPESPAQADNRTCDGLLDCSEAPAPGEPGPAAAPVKTAGTFTASGYAPRPGDFGGKGGEGDNGEAGKSSSLSCVTCGSSCSFCAGTTSTTFGPSGTCGCGGLGGTGGPAGRGGGASVALFAASGARVEVMSGALRAGAGGDGAPGAFGALGGGGTAAAAGDPISCNTACMEVGSGSNCTCTSGAPQTAEGAPGTNGQPGGQGGKGSGGTGGPSFAVVEVEGAKVEVHPSVVLLAGAPGAGAEGSLDGAAGPTF